MTDKLIDKIFIFLFVFCVIFFGYREGYTYIYKIAGCLLVLLFIFRRALLNFPLTTPLEYMIAGSWVIFSLCSGLFAISFNTFFIMFLTVLQVLFISYVICNLLIWMDRPLFPLFAIFWSTLMLSVIVFTNPLAYSVGGRLEGTLGNANLYGLVLLISIMFALHQFFNSTYVFKIVYLASIPFLFYMLGETGSRKAMISVILFLGVYTIVKFRHDITKKPAIAILSTIILVAAGLSSLTYLQQTRHYKRLEHLIDEVKSGSVNKKDESTYHRYKLYDKGYTIGLENPVFGVGLDNFRNATSGGIISEKGAYAHSNYIEIFADTGIVGLLLYCSIYLSLLIKAIKLWLIKPTIDMTGTYLLVTCVLIIYILYDFAMVSYFEKFSWLILTVVIATYKTLITSKIKIQDDKLDAKTIATA